MTTDFFSNIASIEDFNISFSISNNNGTMTISVVPLEKSKDPTLRNLQPLSISGTATELDAEFFNVIKEPIQKTIGLISNANNYIDQKKVLEKQTQEAKDLKEKGQKIIKEIKSLLEVEEEKEANEPKIKKQILALKELGGFTKEVLEYTEELNKNKKAETLF